MTLDEVKLEIEYILSIDPRSPGANFNHDPDCFAIYCKMQERKIYQSGFRLLSKDVRRCQLTVKLGDLD